MGKLIIILSLMLNSICQAQGGFILGVNGITYNHETLQAWATSYEDFHTHNKLGIPKNGLGFVAGFEVYNGSWNVGWNFVWNRRVSKSTQVDLYGNDYTERLKIKFNHVEMPFFYFPFEGPIGIGLTMDVGRQKVRFLDEEKKGTTPMNQIQLASKFGLKFRTSDSGSHLGGMVYYHWLSVFQTDLTTWQETFDYKLNSIGVRLYWVFAP